MRGSRFFSWILIGVVLTSPVFGSRTPSVKKLGEANAAKGAEALAQKLNRLRNTLEMREGKLSENTPAGSIDKNSGNPSQAPTTLHTYVRSVCLEWMNPLNCQSWLDPYVPLHGLDPSSGDFSPAEGMVAAEWQQRQNVDGGGQYRIWDIRRVGDNGGSNVDGEGKLDLSGVVQWSVVSEVSDKLRGLGKETGARAMLQSYDKNTGAGKSVMPNRESLSVIAATFTKQFRNRLVTNLGEMRAAAAPSDFLLSEDVPDCDAYMAAAQAEMARQPSYEEKLAYQGRLNPASRGSMQQRYQACMQARNASIQAVNPVEGQSGDPESEPIDQALTRLNIAAIDRAGVNVTELPRPSNIQLTEQQLTSEYADFEKGGLSIRGIKRETNGTTLNSYNNNLEKAAQSMKNVIARFPNMKDNGDQIRSFKIAPGSKSAVEINGLTREMKRDLASTPFASSPMMDAPSENPESLQEDKPTELTVTRK
jgi:hypothetical protein